MKRIILALYCLFGDPLKPLRDKIECLEDDVQDLKNMMDDKVEKNDVEEAVDEAVDDAKRDLESEINDLNEKIEDLERDVDEHGGRLDDMNDHDGRIQDLEGAIEEVSC